MKYMMLIYGNDELWSSFAPEDLAVVISETDAQNKELFASGELIGAYGVAGQSDAKTISIRDGVPVVSDGPYIEAKEYIGSFSIIDCESYERAVEIALGNPGARLGRLELRPLMHEAGVEM